MSLKCPIWILDIVKSIIFHRTIFVSMAILSGLIIALFLPYPNMPLHPTLFVSLAILSGFAIAPLLAYVEDKSPIENNTSNANILLTATWFGAAVFGVSLILIYNTKEASEAKETVMALAPLGMMIAALIASASVMKNIAETKANEVKKHEKEESKFYLDECIKVLVHVYDLLGKQQNDPLAWREAAGVLISMKNLSKNITLEAHNRIFKLEYNKYSSKLFNSMLKLTTEGNYSYLTPSFFCSINDWENSDFNKSFEESKFKINPKYIIPVYQFAQTPNNNFLDEITDETYYNNWRTIDFEPLKKKLPWLTVIEYIELYKEKIPID